MSIGVSVAQRAGPLYMREPNPTEPANYTSSYTTISKVIADTEIAMHQSAGKAIIIDTISVAPRTIVTTAIEQMILLKLTVSKEQEGGLRN